MAKFKDAKGREWTVRLTVASAETVREATAVDIYELPEDNFDKLFQLVNRNLPKLGAVLYCLCGRQAQELNVSAYDFADELLGESLGAAAEAFYEALTDFFPDRNLREAMRKVQAKGKLVEARLAERTAARIEAMDPTRVADQLIAEYEARRTEDATPKPSSGSVPASSASIPDRSP